MPHRWEYRVVRVLERGSTVGPKMWFALKDIGLEEVRLIDELYRLGDDGWELAASLKGDSEEPTLIFKRVKEGQGNNGNLKAATDDRRTGKINSKIKPFLLL